ncbi:unnamed protein product [Thlaspi arvense]|uniref:Uncharacterized protein n=1 Tax=Thlaspi arvense TaxID=13288 RepID=A0AAU9RCZ8_THLAR|nr:unnamed protein product [Thlaspi arvense]
MTFLSSFNCLATHFKGRAKTVLQMNVSVNEKHDAAKSSQRPRKLLTIKSEALISMNQFLGISSFSAMSPIACETCAIGTPLATEDISTRKQKEDSTTMASRKDTESVFHVSNYMYTFQRMSHVLYSTGNVDTSSTKRNSFLFFALILHFLINLISLILQIKKYSSFNLCLYHN